MGRSCCFENIIHFQRNLRAKSSIATAIGQLLADFFFFFFTQRVVHNAKKKKKKNPMRGIVREYKGDVIMGFCWYLHFLVGKQSRDPEVPRCGQKADVISPQKSCLQSSGRQDPELENDRGNRSCTVQTVLLVFRKQPVPQGSNPSKVCLGNCVSLLSGMCSSV